MPVRFLNLSLLKVLRFFFIVLLIGIFGICLFLPDYSRIKQLKAEKEGLLVEQRRLEEEVVRLKEENKRLETDPSYVEKIAREKLGMVKEGDVLIEINQYP